MNAKSTLNIDVDETAVTDAVAPGAVVIGDTPAEAAGVVDEDGGINGELPARAVRLDGGRVRLPLRYPVTLTIKSSSGAARQERYEALDFSRLNGAAMRAIGAASDDAKTVVAIAKSTGIRDAVMSALYDKMDAADINDAGKIVLHFLA